ncbi:MAG: NUDIX hydrolase [Motilibacteraceae bacterium]
MPEPLRERARAHAEGRVEVVEPKAAATVVLLRDGAAGPEAYLLRRVGSMAFAAGMHVFPGGGVDPRDGEQRTPWAGPDPADWSGHFSAGPQLVRALVCAAVRETFEESGVVLAGPHADDVVADVSGEDWEADRLALLDREVSLSELLARRGLVLRADLLRPWAHWITPEFEPRRYDTRFLVAALPAGQRTRHVGGEADRVQWIRPADAVARFSAGELAMLPPTVVVLRELAAYASVAEVLAGADSRTITPVMPHADLRGDEPRLVLPPGVLPGGARPG